MKLASDPFRRSRNSMAGLPGSELSDVSSVSVSGLHSRSRRINADFTLGWWWPMMLLLLLLLLLLME